MIFEQEYIAFEILDVMYIDQGPVKYINTGRNFDAISFRLEADTEIISEKNSFEPSGNSLCYFPAHVDYNRVSRRDCMIVVHLNVFNYKSDTIEYFMPTNPERYKELFELILIKWKSKETAYKSECASILNLIFAELYRGSRSNTIDKRIYESVIYIEKNCLKSDFELSVAAEKSFISYAYMCKLFKKEMKVSPKKYVIDKRINYARTLLSTDYYSVEEVAEMCGYKDTKHFSSEFKRICGMSPSEYRKKR